MKEVVLEDREVQALDTLKQITRSGNYSERLKAAEAILFHIQRKKDSESFSDRWTEAETS